jgi:hypothetical protein
LTATIVPRTKTTNMRLRRIVNLTSLGGITWATPRAIARDAT